MTYDDEGGGRLAVEHLIAVGRRRIAYVAGPRHHHSASARFLGWRHAARGRRAAGRPARTSPSAPGRRSGAGRPRRCWRPRSPTSTGSSAAVTRSPAASIDGLREAGRQVPDDVAVVGFDNWDVMVTGRRPMLTSIDPDLHTVGRVAAEHLLLAIDGGPAGGCTCRSPARRPGVHGATARSRPQRGSLRLRPSTGPDQPGARGPCRTEWRAYVTATHPHHGHFARRWPCRSQAFPDPLPAGPRPVGGSTAGRQERERVHPWANRGSGS